ncbi:MAG: hypothetical protein QW548_01155 [Candidatus Aenigmatarchaeota archaeon]
MPKFKQQIDEKSLAWTLGLLFAVVHAAWSIVVLSGFGQAALEWLLGVHFTSMAVTVLPFSLTSAIVLVVFAFAAGAIIGLAAAALWNWVVKWKF